MTFQLNSARVFKLWEYKLTHSQILIRSTKGNTENTRIDVVFKDVHEINMPTSIEGLHVEVSTSLENGCPQYYSKYIIRDNNNTIWHVISGAAFSHEDQGEYYDPSFFSDFS